MSIYTATDIVKAFGGLVAVDSVSFDIPQGKIVSIIGPNGAGKTTFFNILTGLYKPTSGVLEFDGKDVTRKRPDQITHAGVARTFQNIRLFGTMSATENVMIGEHARMKAGLFGSILQPPPVRRGDEPERVGALHRVHAEGSRRPQPDDPADRARHEGRHGRVGADHRPRPR